MRLSPRDRQLVTRAYAAWDEQDWQRAAAALGELLERHPDEAESAGWWFDAALAYKFLRDWGKAREFGRQAAARVPRGRQEPAFWNLGIAATALGDWTTARDAWAGYGLRLRAGGGEIQEDFGICCVRLNPGPEPEIVWARRICPARAQVVSVPLSTGRRFGEIVLHDAAPTGERVVEGEIYPVFDELMRWRTSALPTLAVTITATSTADIQELIGLFTAREFGAEAADGVLTPGRRIIHLAAPFGEAETLLETWRVRGARTRMYEGLHGTARLYATTEGGETAEDPPAAALLDLLAGLEPDGDNRFLILERLDTPEDKYMQVFRDNSTTYQVEYRDGGPNAHYEARSRDLRQVHEAFLRWADQSEGWRKTLSWRKVEVGD